MRDYVPTWSTWTCLHTSVVYMAMCLCVSVVYGPMYLRGNVSKACQLVLRGNKRANVTYGVPVFQIGVPTYQVAWQFFKHSSYETFKVHCYIKKFYILLDIIVYHMYMYPSKHSSWWRRLQEVLIKTNMFTLTLRLQKTSSRRLEDVLVKTNIFVLAIVLPRRLQGVFKTSSRRLAKTSSRHLQDVFKTFWRRLQKVFKTSSRRLQDVSSS